MENITITLNLRIALENVLFVLQAEANNYCCETLHDAGKQLLAIIEALPKDE